MPYCHSTAGNFSIVHFQALFVPFGNQMAYFKSDHFLPGRFGFVPLFVNLFSHNDDWYMFPAIGWLLAVREKVINVATSSSQHDSRLIITGNLKTVKCNVFDRGRNAQRSGAFRFQGIRFLLIYASIHFEFRFFLPNQEEMKACGFRVASPFPCRKAPRHLRNELNYSI